MAVGRNPEELVQDDFLDDHDRLVSKGAGVRTAVPWPSRRGKALSSSEAFLYQLLWHTGGRRWAEILSRAQDDVDSRPFTFSRTVRNTRDSKDENPDIARPLAPVVAWRNDRGWATETAREVQVFAPGGYRCP